MRKRILTGACCTAVLTCLFALTVLLVRTGASETALAAGPDSQIAATAPAASGMEAMTFIVREYGGKVCVFQSTNEAQPAVTTDISVDSLREADRQQLYAGIRVTGRENLLALLEDFGS